MANNRFTNKERALARMAAIPAAIKGEVRVAMAENRTELAEAIRRAAPEDDGDLRDSVTSRDISNASRIAGQVSAGNEKAFYARMVECGTPRQAAQPFFYPMYRARKKRLKSRISRAAGKGARRAVGKT